MVFRVASRKVESAKAPDVARQRPASARCGQPGAAPRGEHSLPNPQPGRRDVAQGDKVVGCASVNDPIDKRTTCEGAPSRG